MKLVTIQPIEVLTALRKTGTFSSSYAETVGIEEDCRNQISNAFAWYIDQMKARVGAAPDGVYYPIWAWYKNDDSSLYDGTWGEAGKTYARIEIEVEDERVLLSDFLEWHNPLNNFPYCEGETDEELEASYDAIVAGGEEAIKESWSKIFDVSKSDCIQATFWELRSEDILSYETFVSKGGSFDAEELDA